MLTSRKFMVILVILTLTSCAKITHISTNLDNDNFQHYFSPAKVVIVDSEQAFKGKYQYLGLVEGESCQQKPHHAEPSDIEARTQARRNAFKLGANAIIFQQCILISNNEADKHCRASKVCYGRAYLVEHIN